jgi:hypothetical protein
MMMGQDPRAGYLGDPASRSMSDVETKNAPPTSVSLARPARDERRPQTVSDDQNWPSEPQRLWRWRVGPDEQFP